MNNTTSAPVAMQLDAETARRWLSNNEVNRKLSRNVALKYMNDMLAGRWRIGNDIIVLTHSDRMRNGQHRSQALVWADEISPGITIPVFVRRVPDDNDEMNVFDGGKTRSSGDVISMHGLSNAHHIASMSRLVLLYDAAPELIWSGEVLARNANRTQQIRFALDNVDALNEALEHSSAPMQRVALSVLNYLVARDSASPEEWDEFVTGLKSGAGLHPDDPRLRLRNILIRPARDRAQWGGGQYMLGLHIVTWNKWVADEQIKNLLFRKSSLPMPMVR